MLKKRLMGVVVVREGIAVQSIGFQRYLPIGKPAIVVDFLNQWGIDEIAVLDITATIRGRVNFELIRELSPFCQVPLTYAGGLKTASDMTQAVQAGADKVMINAAFRNTPELVTRGAEKLGNQCIVVSLDVVRNGSEARAYDYINKKATGATLLEQAQHAEELGAGEIFLNSVDRDGSKQGFDLEIAQEVSSQISVPLTLCGGVGHPDHFLAGLRIPNVSAVAAGNYFNFTEHSATTTKQYLNSQENANLRHETYFSYADSGFLPNGRIARKSDDSLKEMLFESHPKEVI